MADDLRMAVAGLSLKDLPAAFAGDGSVEASSSRSSGEELEKVGCFGGERMKVPKREAEPLKFDPAELEDLAYLGEGAGGAVMKVRSRRTNVVMAKKVCSPRVGFFFIVFVEREIEGFCVSIDHPGVFKPSDPSTDSPRTTVPLHLLVPLHRRPLRLLPHRRRLDDRDPDGVLRRQKPGRRRQGK